MAARRSYALAAALLLGCAAAVSAHPCNVVTGFSPVFGAGSSGSEKVVDQVSDWKAGGDLTKLALFYSSAIGCLTGVESTYGASAAEKIGVNLNQQTASLELVPEEYFVQAQYKAGQCLEYLYLRTNKGRALAVGNTRSPTQTQTLTVDRDDGFLGAVRGWTDGALTQLQLVWGAVDCSAADAAEASAGAGGAPAEQPAAAEQPAPAAAEPAAEAPAQPAAEAAPPAEEVPSAAEPPSIPNAEVVPVVQLVSEMGAPLNVTPAVPPPPLKAVCAPRSDMCDTGAPAGRAAFCKAVKPFESNKCVGGCCVSSGKCKFGSCAANGLGKDVSMACFGNNAIPSPLALLGNKCGHLACKLAVPGCKSALMGGNCVGTVVATQDVSKLHSQGAKYLGHPCVEITPTGGVIDVKGIDVGLPAREYVIAAWKVCDCVDPSALPKPGESFPVMRANLIPKPQIKLPKIPVKGGLFGLGKNNSAGDELAGPGKLAMMRDLIAGTMSKDTTDPFADFMSSDEAAAAANAAAEPAAEVAVAEEVTDSQVEGIEEGAVVPESAPVPASEAAAFEEAPQSEAAQSEAAQSEAVPAVEGEAPMPAEAAPVEPEGAEQPAPEPAAPAPEAAAPAPAPQEQPAPEPAAPAPEAAAPAPAPEAEGPIDPFTEGLPPPEAAPVEPEGTYDPSAPENMQPAK
ncbi:hypothetical protein Rsub_01025 [Raphidocelis subcapitata]|uniref:Uncharacterized protein n=1 Tax=Raphidocelis subcapitata TaxID=307507 RepID=A0A2V0NRY6_9CHLO|nr:hypothetical protein Rsub_01025 [Raphidocelis subcapitata]|eukprot:GBF88313.1 hypothetical protein Rsub_01025 [Raphidocelis subcapitata]